MKSIFNGIMLVLIIMLAQIGFTILSVLEFVSDNWKLLTILFVLVIAAKGILEYSFIKKYCLIVIGSNIFRDVPLFLFFFSLLYSFSVYPEQYSLFGWVFVGTGFVVIAILLVALDLYVTCAIADEEDSLEPDITKYVLYSFFLGALQYVIVLYLCSEEISQLLQVLIK